MYKQSPKSPLMKALIGKQENLPQALKAQIQAAPESPAKAMEGPGIPKEAGKTGTAGANSAKGKNGSTKPKYDKELNSLVSQRKGLKKGTAEYNKVQNRINEKLGSKVRRRTEETTKVPTKKANISVNVPKPDIVRSSTNTKPAADKQAASFEADLAKQNSKAPMGSEKGSKAPAAKPAAKKPVAAKKPAAKKTAGQKVKGAVRKAKLAQLDRKANRQEARETRKTDRKNAKAEKLREKADKLSSPAKNYKKGYYGK